MSSGAFLSAEFMDPSNPIVGLGIGMKPPKFLAICILTLPEGFGVLLFIPSLASQF